MNELFENLTKALKTTDGGSKMIAALVGVAIVVAIGAGALVAKQPHYDLLWQHLNDQERAKAGKALADAGIDFRASSSPGPYSIYVDEADWARANAAAYAAGAFERPLKGIVPNDGVTAFMSAAERDAHLEKALWQDMESMLETYEFVRSATVVRPKRRATSLMSKQDQPMMAAVTLDVSNGRSLTRDQSNLVARIVQTGLGVDSEHLTISDQQGNSIYDGGREVADQLVDKELLEHQQTFERKQAEKVNELLAGVLGPDKARVEVNSEWNWEQSAEQLTEAVGDGILLKSEKTESETPGPVRVGGAAGLSANTRTGDFGIESAAPRTESGSVSTNTDETKTFAPTTRTTSRVQTQPQLKRLSIVAVIDASVVTAEDGTRNEALVTDLEQTIRVASGYNEARGDSFHLSTQASFFQPEEVEGEEAAEPGGLSPMVGTLLRRGVEIVTALVFILFLLKSLKAARPQNSKGATGTGAAAAGAAPGAESEAEPVDPEALARAQIEELLKSEPEKVGTILANWARENATVAS